MTESSKACAVDFSNSVSFDLIREMMETVKDAAGLKLPEIQISPSPSRRYNGINFIPYLKVVRGGDGTPFAALTFSPFLFSDWSLEETRDNFLKNFFLLMAHLDEFVCGGDTRNYNPKYVSARCYKRGKELGIIMDWDGRNIIADIDKTRPAFARFKELLRDIMDRFPTTPVLPKPRAKRQRIEKTVKKIWIVFTCSKCGTVVEYGPCPPDYCGRVEDTQCPLCGKTFAKGKISRKTFVKKEENV
jgi:hypothetical protein